MKLSVSAYRAYANAHKKILSSGYQTQLNYGSTSAAAASSTSAGLYAVTTPGDDIPQFMRDMSNNADVISLTETGSSSQENRGGRLPGEHSEVFEEETASFSTACKKLSQRKTHIPDEASDGDMDWAKTNQRWMKLRTTVQISSAMQKKPPLKREDSFLKRFSTRQISETHETVEDTASTTSADTDKSVKRRRRYLQKRRSVVNPDENFHFYWLMVLTVCVLYNLWTLIVRESFPELQKTIPTAWFIFDTFTDLIFILDIVVQLRTGYLEQGLMVYDDKKLAYHYINSKNFVFDVLSLIPLDLLQLKFGTHPLLRFTRFCKVYRCIKFYYIVESRTVWPNLWRVVNLIHILLILAHWFGCFYYLLSEAEGFQGDWVYPYRPGDYATLSRKYLGSLYWSTLTLTTIGDLPTPETNAELQFSVDGPRSIPRRGIKSRLLQFDSNYGYVFTIVSYLIGVFIFATIVGQVGNVITNRNANRLEFERLLDGAKTYMRHHKVPNSMKRRVLRWYDYSWSRGRIQGGGDINTALGLLPDKLKTELALHVNLSVLKKVTIFQECQPEFLHDLVLKMKAYIFTPGDSICRKGEVAREMFIIADGILEVLSETGKVLTTMKAGDFFGEIGILNLDGLNKRTADVRSVGYSELFSLSREDVLAAMKDYPDAQEILHSLGRKRLMEVRCVNKKYPKIPKKTNDVIYHINTKQPHDGNENTTAKIATEKLKSEVVGLKDVIKKTRASLKREESFEMHNTHHTSPKSAKTTKKKFSKVEFHKETTDDKVEYHEKIVSPIGAGLPLLQRLRLLKEKQDREERAVKTTPPPPPPPSLQICPPHSLVTCTLSPQESIQEEPEREITENPPLVLRQHLQLKQQQQPAQHAKVKSIITSSEDKTTAHDDDGTAVATILYPLTQVPLKQRVQKLMLASARDMQKRNKSEHAAKSSATFTNAIVEAAVRSDPTKIDNIEIRTDSLADTCCKEAKNVKPSSKTNVSLLNTTSAPSQPWSKLKLAASCSASYSNLTNSIEPSEPRIAVRNYSASNIPQYFVTDETENGKVIAEEANASKRPRVQQISMISKALMTTPHTGGKQLDEFKITDRAAGGSKKTERPPGYTQLPRPKHLQSVKEQQSLAELEKTVQTRSFSLDSPNNYEETSTSDCLYRWYSDASGIYSQLLSTYNSNSTNISNIPPFESSRIVAQTPTYLASSRPLPGSLESVEISATGQTLNESVTPGMESLANATEIAYHGIKQNLNARTTKAERAAHRRSYGGMPTSYIDAQRIATTDPITELEGIHDAYQYFNEMLCGIKNMISSQINEIHLKLDSQFSCLATEVKKRDRLIAQLQTKLRHLEDRSQTKRLRRRSKDRKRSSAQHYSCELLPQFAGSNSSDSSAELLFMRGDSIDTVLNSSPPVRPTEADVTASSSETSTSSRSNYSYPKRRMQRGALEMPRPETQQRDKVCESNNSVRFPADSVILDIDGSSSSSSLKAPIPLAVENTSDASNETSNGLARPTGHRTAQHHGGGNAHNDWEVRMLAAEMEKQERKRGNSLCVTSGDYRPYSNILRRRRRKYGGSDSECSGGDSEVEDSSKIALSLDTALIRPRASSLDQFNLRHGPSADIFKAIDSDRDRSQL